MGSIGIVGLESDPDRSLEPDTVERLAGAGRVVVPSGDGDAAKAVRQAGVEPSTFQDIGLLPGAPSGALAEILVELAATEDVVLASTSYPLLRAGVVPDLLHRSEGAVELFPVDSPLGVLVLAFDIDLTAGADIMDPDGLGATRPDRDSHLVVTGLRNRVLARKVSELLLRDFPGDHPVVIAGCLRSGGFDLRASAVSEFADADWLCPDSVVYVAPSRPEPSESFDDLVRIIAVLRGPDGCPWDREQTASSLRKHVIEEAYEAVSAIEADDAKALAEELGDLLLQIVLQAQIGSEEGTFDIDDVTAGITRKLRRRHPHVFGGVEVADAQEVSANWDEIKRDEKEADSALAGVPAGLPSLARAQKISKRAVGVGFEWESVEDVWAKLHEEIEELKEAQEGTAHVVEEVGDVLFTMVNVSRKLGVDAEVALRDACDKFSRRFVSMERQAAERGVSLEGLGTDEMELLWHDAKEEERANGA